MRRNCAFQSLVLLASGHLFSCPRTQRCACVCSARSLPPRPPRSADEKAQAARDALLQFHVMVRQGVQPNAFMYTSLIGTMAQAGLEWQAYKLFSRLLEQGLTPLPETYAALRAATAPSRKKLLDDLTAKMHAVHRSLPDQLLAADAESAAKAALAAEEKYRAFRTGEVPKPEPFRQLPPHAELGQAAAATAEAAAGATPRSPAPAPYATVHIRGPLDVWATHTAEEERRDREGGGGAGGSQNAQRLTIAADRAAVAAALEGLHEEELRTLLAVQRQLRHGTKGELVDRLLDSTPRARLDAVLARRKRYFAAVRAVLEGQIREMKEQQQQQAGGDGNASNPKPNLNPNPDPNLNPDPSSSKQPAPLRNNNSAREEKGQQEEEEGGGEGAVMAELEALRHKYSAGGGLPTSHDGGDGAGGEGEPAVDPMLALTLSSGEGEPAVDPMLALTLLSADEDPHRQHVERAAWTNQSSREADASSGAAAGNAHKTRGALSASGHPPPSAQTAAAAAAMTMGLFDDDDAAAAAAECADPLADALRPHAVGDAVALQAAGDAALGRTPQEKHHADPAILLTPWGVMKKPLRSPPTSPAPRNPDRDAPLSQAELLRLHALCVSGGGGCEAPADLLRRYARQHNLKWNRRFPHELAGAVAWHVATFPPTAAPTDDGGGGGGQQDFSALDRPTPSDRYAQAADQEAERQGFARTLEAFEALQVVGRHARNVRVVDSSAVVGGQRAASRATRAAQNRADAAERRARNLQAASALRASALEFSGPGGVGAGGSDALLGFGSAARLDSNVIGSGTQQHRRGAGERPNGLALPQQQQQEGEARRAVAGGKRKEKAEAEEEEAQELPPWMVSRGAGYNPATGRFGDPSRLQITEVLPGKFRAARPLAAQTAYRVDAAGLSDDDRAVLREAAAQAEGEAEAARVRAELKSAAAQARSTHYARFLDNHRQARKKAAKEKRDAGEGPVTPGGATQRKRLSAMLKSVHHQPKAFDPSKTMEDGTPSREKWSVAREF